MPEETDDLMGTCYPTNPNKAKPNTTEQVVIPAYNLKNVADNIYAVYRSCTGTFSRVVDIKVALGVIDKDASLIIKSMVLYGLLLEQTDNNGYAWYKVSDLGKAIALNWSDPSQSILVPLLQRAALNPDIYKTIREVCDNATKNAEGLVVDYEGAVVNHLVTLGITSSHGYRLFLKYKQSMEFAGLALTTKDSTVQPIDPTKVHTDPPKTHEPKDIKLSKVKLKPQYAGYIKPITVTYPEIFTIAYQPSHRITLIEGNLQTKEKVKALVEILTTLSASLPSEDDEGED